MIIARLFSRDWCGVPEISCMCRPDFMSDIRESIGANADIYTQPFSGRYFWDTTRGSVFKPFHHVFSVIRASRSLASRLVLHPYIRG
jgi:hypothetical protein